MVSKAISSIGPIRARIGTVGPERERANNRCLVTFNQPQYGPREIDRSRQSTAGYSSFSSLLLSSTVALKGIVVSLPYRESTDGGSLRLCCEALIPGLDSER